MLRSKTLFIIGAGASAEVDMPTGVDLRTKIGNLVDIRFPDGYEQKSGDHLITEALRANIKMIDGKTDITKAIIGKPDINDYLHAGWQIHKAMPQADSIDTFIETHQGNEAIELCSKLAIVRSILDAEKRSRLAVDHLVAPLTLDLLRIEETWFTSFFRFLVAGRHKDDVENLFDDVSIISFNYDRCLEQFLFYATQSYFVISPEEAANVVNRLHIFHPYGRVGFLPWQQQKTSIEYGVEPYSQQLLDLSKKIITYGERTKDTESTNRIRKVVAEAETVVFLGFAFHRQNLELIKPTGPTAAKRVFGTAYGLSDSERDLISNELCDFFAQTISSNSIILRSDQFCFPFLSEYRRSLSF